MKIRITYDDRVVQVRNVIKQDDYHRIVKPVRTWISDLKSQKDYKQEASEMETILFNLYGEFLTDNSPLWKALTGDGILRLNGGETHVKMQLIEENTNVVSFEYDGKIVRLYRHIADLYAIKSDSRLDEQQFKIALIANGGHHLNLLISNLYEKGGRRPV